jgi:hypothetical protein
MFEPKTLPTERGAPLDHTAATATVSSGSDVEKAIKLKPTAVLPSRVIFETLSALFNARLLAQFNTRKETAITTTLIIRPVTVSSAIFFCLLRLHYKHSLSHQVCIAISL